jgi:membrane associated rhomboid family serine protease
MFGFSEFSEQGRPWFHVGRVAVTSTVLLVGVFSLSMVLVALLGAAQAVGFLSQLPLFSRLVWHGEVWRLVTWPLVNGPTIWFALSMLMLFFFGREVERVLGRSGLLKFAGWVAGALTVVTLLLPGAVLAGSDLIGFGIFLAFAIMHPGAPMFFGLQTKWVAIILIAIHALQHLAARNWPGLIQLATLCVASAVVLQSMGAAYGLPWLRLPTIRFKRSGGGGRTGSAGLSRGEGGTGRGPSGFVSPEREIDRLLDKVAAEGLHSLTDAERRILADASDRYQRRK